VSGAVAKKKLVIAVVVIVVAGAICAGYFAVRGGSQESDTGQEQKTQPEKKKVDREALLAKLAKERGGLPIDQALKEAKTPEAKAFLERDMAYQRQTRAQAADEARSRLTEIRQQLARSTDEKTTATLKKQVEMLEMLVAELEETRQNPL
jgi:flagellar basal body-associated protein FliL